MTSTDRVRKLREARKRGVLFTAPVQITRDDTDLLIEAGYLAGWNENDPAAVADALVGFLANAHLIRSAWRGETRYRSRFATLLSSPQNGDGDDDGELDGDD